jgi:hypothetical protein
VKLATVFHPVNNFSHDTAGPVRGDRATKRKMSVELVRNCPFIGSGTNLANRRSDSFRARLT